MSFLREYIVLIVKEEWENGASEAKAERHKALDCGLALNDLADYDDEHCQEEDIIADNDLENVLLVSNFLGVQEVEDGQPEESVAHDSELFRGLYLRKVIGHILFSKIIREN